MSHPDTLSEEMRKSIPDVPCPKCATVMELKTVPDPFAMFIGGSTLAIWQCPACKNVEVQ